MKQATTPAQHYVYEAEPTDCKDVTADNLGTAHQENEAKNYATICNNHPTRSYCQCTQTGRQPDGDRCRPAHEACCFCPILAEGTAMQVWPDGLALNLGRGQCSWTPPIMSWFLQS